jgi:hypothetical protein
MKSPGRGGRILTSAQLDSYGGKYTILMREVVFWSEEKDRQVRSHSPTAIAVLLVVIFRGRLEQ